MVQVRIRPDLVQRAAQEHLVCGDADQIERARRHEKDLVGRRREVVLTVTPVLEVRVHRLPRFLEIENRVADFLHLSPERRLEATRLQEHGGDPRIDLGFSEVVDDRADRRRPDSPQVADDVGRGHFGKGAADAEDERRVGRHGGLASEEQVEHHEPGDRQGEQEPDHGEDDGESAASHFFNPLVERS